MLLDRGVVTSQLLDPGAYPLQRSFRRKALTSRSSPHEQRKRDFLRTMTPALLTDGLRIEGGI